MEQFELPANIKQIGSIGDGPRIYMEDYAYTYLTQYAEAGGYNERLAFLIGRRIVIDGVSVLFISGAIAGKHCDIKNGLTVFTQKSSEYAEEMIKQYFPGLDVVGWMQSQPSYSTVLNSAYLQFHLDNFKDSGQVMFVMDPIEKSNAFYVYGPDGLNLVEARGYFIYYDKNRSMHEYMLDNKVAEPKMKPHIEPDLDPIAFLPKVKAAEPQITEPHFVKDSRASRSGASYRRNSIEQRRVLNLVVSLCAVLLIVCFIMGAGLIQNQDRISGMEQQIVDLSTAYRNLSVSANNGTAQAFANDNPPGDNADLIVDDGNQALAESQGSAALDSPAPDANAQAVSTPGTPETQAPASNHEAAATDPPSSAPTPTPTPAPTPETAAATDAPLSQVTNYTVQAGDTLNSISLQFYGDKGEVQKIMDANDIQDANLIYAGEQLVIPAK
ncbi:MAG: LysM peptidoglycan-binding domain-containing protein [Defluviitaleaceae bacterium]|nr:LysM peptidoglycan-binding domain-containing protein [Defluviitaleaceae bacterium]